MPLDYLGEQKQLPKTPLKQWALVFNIAAYLLTFGVWAIMVVSKRPQKLADFLGFKSSDTALYLVYVIMAFAAISAILTLLFWGLFLIRTINSLEEYRSQKIVIALLGIVSIPVGALVLWWLIYNVR